MSVLKTSEGFFTFKRLCNAKMLKRLENYWFKSAKTDKSKKHAILKYDYNLLITSQTVKEPFNSKRSDFFKTDPNYAHS